MSSSHDMPLPNPEPPAAQAETALQRFRRFGADEELTDPAERLRAFCSFAMNGQDWIDAERFFEALVTKDPESPSPKPTSPALPRVSEWLRSLPNAVASQIPYLSNGGFAKDCNDAADILDSITAKQTSNPAVLWQHVKTGGVYAIVGLAVREWDGIRLVLYRNIEDGLDMYPWARPESEFLLRFLPVKSGTVQEFRTVQEPEASAQPPAPAKTEGTDSE
jgi:hypothetical protein